MKFLCDQCKAKYQIADEKVSGGKTLKMKCRKCGHIIEIRAASAVPGSIPPPAGAGVGETMQLSALTDEAAAKIEAAVAAPKKPEPKPAAPPRAAPSAPGAIARPAAPARPATAPTAARPATPAPKAGGLLPRPATTAPEKKESALASAFTKVAAKKSEVEPTATNAAGDPPADEWYAAIDDVPVGPVRLSELRSKYASGAVHDDSLCWREGFEEWRPLRTLTELHRLVREEVSGAMGLPRTSILPTAGSPSARGREQPRTQTSTGRPAAQATPARAATSGARGNVIPFARQGGVAARKLEEDMFGEDAPTQIGAAAFTEAPPKPEIAADPFASPAMPSASQPLPALRIETAPLDFGANSPSNAPGRLTMTENLVAWRKQRGISGGIVALIGAACLLGGVVLAVVFVRMKVQAPVVVEKRVEVAGPEKTVIIERSVAVPSGPSPSMSSSTDPSKTAGKGPYSPGAGTPTAATSSSGGTKVAGIAGPEIPIGPDPGGGTPVGGGKAKPDGGDWNSCAAARTHSVRKFCYDEGVGSGSAAAAVTICVNPDGSVSSTTVESSAPSATFGTCVARQLKGCKLPPTTAGGCAKIPFIFG